MTNTQIPLVLSCGIGRNSTALAIELIRRGIYPSLLLFADTGGEKPDTYDYLWSHFQPYLEKNGLTITVVRVMRSKYQNLEDQCLQTKHLPSRAYGLSSCSVKWKIEPQDAFVKHWQPAIDCWTRGEKILKAIGFHADESRSDIEEDARYRYWYPLREWNYGQEDCEQIILNAGLPLPPKSACYYCPSSKKHEVIALRNKYPELLERALAIERNAVTTVVKGLGRKWSWADLIAADEAQLKLFPEAIQQSCMCNDDE